MSYSAGIGGGDPGGVVKQDRLRVETLRVWSMLFVIMFVIMIVGSPAGAVDAATPQHASEIAPLQQTHPEETKNDGDPKQASGTPPPIIIHVHPAEKTDSERAEETQERHEKAKLDRQLVELTADLAKFTKGLFAATIALFVATAGLAYFGWRQSKDMGKSIAAAQKSADAALLQAKVMVSSERPYVIPHGPVLDGFGELVNGVGENRSVRIRYEIDNRGKGIAFLDTHATGHEIRQDDVGLPMPNPTTPGLGRMPLGPGSKFTSDAVFASFEISEIDLFMMQKGIKSLFVYGYFRYFGLVGNARKTGFIFEFQAREEDVEQSTFVTHPSAEWWFDEEENAPRPQGS